MLVFSFVDYEKSRMLPIVNRVERSSSKLQGIDKRNSVAMIVVGTIGRIIERKEIGRLGISACVKDAEKHLLFTATQIENIAHGNAICNREGVLMMKDEVKQAIIDMRNDGKSYAEIGKALGLATSTVSSVILRSNKPIYVCKYCGRRLKQSGYKHKVFCDDVCRYRWNKAHPQNKRAFYELKCHYCGKEFIAYGNPNRKFCCRECYLKGRDGGTIDD